MTTLYITIFVSIYLVHQKMVKDNNILSMGRVHTLLRHPVDGPILATYYTNTGPKIPSFS